MIKLPIVHADELPPCQFCGEPFCPLHDQHYWECPCVGPHDAEERGFEIVAENGKLWAIKYGTDEVETGNPGRV